MPGLIMKTVYNDSVMTHCILSHAALVAGELYTLDPLPVISGITSDWWS